MHETDSPAAETPAPLESPAGVPWHQLSLLLLGLFVWLAALGDLLRLLEIDGAPLQAIGGLCLLGSLITAVTALIARRRLARTGRRLPHVPRLRIVNFGVGTLAVLTLLATLPVPAIHRAEEAAARHSADGERPTPSGVTPTGDPLSTDGWQTLRMPSGGAAIRVPPEWKPQKLEGVAGEPWFTAGSPADDLQVSVVGVPRSDFAVDDLTGFTALMIRRLEPMAAVSSQIPVIVDGRPAREIRHVSPANGVKLRFLSLIVETPEVYWIVDVWATPSRFETHQETLRRVCYSFTVD